MYIHNIEGGIDELQGYGLVDPNIVSGADLDKRLFDRPSFFNYVADDEVDAAKINYEKALADFRAGQQAVQTAGTIAGQTMGELRTNGERLQLLKAIDGGVAKGTSYDNKYQTIGYEIDLLTKRNAELGQVYQSRNEELQKLNYQLRDLNAKLEATKAEYDAIVKRQQTEGKPPVETTSGSGSVTTQTTSSGGSGGVYSGGSGSVSSSSGEAEVVTEVPKVGLIEQIGQKVGLSKNQTYMGLGAAGILLVALIVKK